MMAGRLSEATAMTRAGGDARIALVRDKALSIRRRALTMVFEAQLGHPGGDMSVTDILGTVVPHERCFGALKGKVKAGPMTFFRVSSDDHNGTLKSYVGEGAFTDDPYAMDGGIAVTQITRLRSLLGFIARNGFEHHVAMVRGNHAAAINEAVTRYLDWPTYCHVADPANAGSQHPIFRV